MQLLTISSPMINYGFGERRLDEDAGCTCGEVHNGSRLELVRDLIVMATLTKKRTNKNMS